MNVSNDRITPRSSDGTKSTMKSTSFTVASASRAMTAKWYMVSSLGQVPCAKRASLLDSDTAFDRATLERGYAIPS